MSNPDCDTNYIAGRWSERGEAQGCAEQTQPALAAAGPFGEILAQEAGFSLHAGVVAEPHERARRERLCRYIARPPVSEERLSLTPNGNIRYQLKIPYRDGTTHVIFEPLDFIARLAALVPKPRVHLTRYHGVFAPNSKHRALVTPAKRGKSQTAQAHAATEERTPAERCASMSLRAAPQASVQYRHRDLPGLRRAGQDHRLHRGSGGDQEDP